MPAWRLTIEANGHTFYVRHRRNYYHLAMEVGGYPSFSQLSEARMLVRQMARRIIDGTNRNDLHMGDDSSDYVWTVKPAKLLEVVCTVTVILPEEVYQALARDYRQYASEAHRAFEASATTFKKAPRKRAKGG